jgi:hypothetical protein
MDDKVTIIRCNRVIKNQSSNAFPICKSAPLEKIGPRVDPSSVTSM